MTEPNSRDAATPGSAQTSAESLASEIDALLAQEADGTEEAEILEKAHAAINHVLGHA